MTQQVSIKNILRDYQYPSYTQGIEQIKHFGVRLDASDMGTGKTYVNAAIAVTLNLPVIVICPKVVRTSWEEVFKIFNYSKVSYVTNYEKLVRGNHPIIKWERKKLLRKNPVTGKYDEILSETGNFKWVLTEKSLVIFDEVHRCKGLHTGASQILVKMKDAAIEQGHKIILASATVATSPNELRSVGYALDLHGYADYKNWCKAISNDVDFTDADEEQRKAIMEEINRRIFPWRGSRIKIDELGDKFPPSVISANAYDMGNQTGKIVEVYDEMMAKIYALDERSKTYREHIFAIMIEARRRVELYKSLVFCDLVKDSYEDGHSVAVFLNFQDSMDVVAKSLNRAKIKYSEIVGNQSVRERNCSIADFQSDKHNVILCNLRAGGVGVSLHDLHGKRIRVSYISPSFSAFDVKQAIGRTRRDGGKTISYANIVFSAKTIEETAARNIQQKLKNLGALNDRDFYAGFNIDI